MDERLRSIIELFGLTQREFAKSIGISQSSVAGVLYGRSKGFTTEHLAEIAKAYNVNLHWLITGKGKMLVEGAAKTETLGNEILVLLERQPEAKPQIKKLLQSGPESAELLATLAKVPKAHRKAAKLMLRGLLLDE